MIISGNSYHKIANQTGNFALRAKVSFDNVVGNGYVGISGSELIKWDFESGRILHNDKIVSSYLANTPVEILARFKCGIADGQYDYWINGEPKSVDNTLTTGSFTRLVVDSNDCNLTLEELGISGRNSVLSLDPTKSITVTGFSIPMYNSDSTMPCQVYNIIPKDVLGVVVSGWTTGEFSSSGDIHLTIPSVPSQNIYIPLSFETNIGYFDLSFSGLGSESTNPRIINFGGTKQNYAPNESGSYFLIVYNNTTGEYRVSLDYSSSEGNQYAHAYGTGIGTGFFSSGTIGTISGSKVVYTDSLTGYLTLESYRGFSSNVLTSGYGYANIYATGSVTYPYDIQAIGYHFGSMATGMITGTLTGIVNDGSGYYHFYQPVTGVPAMAITATGIISYELGTFTGYVDDNVIAVGTREGAFVGEFLGNDPILEGFHTFSGSWDLLTGNFNSSGTGYQDYFDNGWYETLPAYSYNNTGDIALFQLPPGYNKVEIQVAYRNPFGASSIDTVSLNVDTPDSGYTIPLTGIKNLNNFTTIPTLPSGGLLTESDLNILTESSIIIYT